MALPRLRLNYLIILIFLTAIGLGLWLWRQLTPPERGPLRLTAVEFSALPGWTGSDPRPALAAFRRSCAVLETQPAAAPMGGAGYGGTMGAWQAVCAALPAETESPEALRGWFERRFRAFAVSAGGAREGLFTGYYEPELKASRTPHGPYQIPIYGAPGDLVSVDLGLFRKELAHERIAGRLEGHRLVPYPSRAEIDAKGLKTAQVLFWAEDPIAVFFLHIQGSGRVALDDGTVVRVAYAAQNGRPYTAIGRTLISEGAIPREQISLQSIRAWLTAHPAQARRVMETNKSYVFFRETALGDPRLGSAGSEGAALTPTASLAVDNRLHPLGVPLYVDATRPDSDAAKADRPLQGLLIAQDTGGAIRGPVRGDVFWGFGNKAQEIAGRMKARGRMFVLLPAAPAAKIGGEKEFPETAR